MNKVDSYYAKSYKPKYMNPKLENVDVETRYCLTININQSALEEADSFPQVMHKYQAIFSFLDRYGYYEMYPELGENTGKLHYHGWYQFKDILSIGQFYLHLLDLQGMCTYTLKALFQNPNDSDEKPEDTWETYIHKQGKILKPLCKYYVVPYRKVNIKKAKNAILSSISEAL